MSVWAGISPWAVNGGLRPYFEALRNRLLLAFEIQEITHKPKLVAVTSCREKSGASTVAAGLAASLSETGDGNVLLVDMNAGEKKSHHFRHGDLKCGLADALEQEKRSLALVSHNLYMVVHNFGDDEFACLLLKRFTHLVSSLKRSDYDYIIFDLPPVSQISVTPQLSRYMDNVLMVVESEKTNRDSVKRAGAMLTISGATPGVVLNKTRQYLPRWLRQEV